MSTPMVARPDPLAVPLARAGGAAELLVLRLRGLQVEIAAVATCAHAREVVDALGPCLQTAEQLAAGLRLANEVSR